ncbi:uncharacterized protein WCC33_001309 [Rhinophrynus dorsalis]
MPKCIVKGCSSWTGAKESNFVLHVFPNDLNHIKMWLLQTNQEFGNIDDFAQNVLERKKTGLYRMCSKHFTSECYHIQGSRLVLKKEAIPTIFSDSESSLTGTTEIGPPRKRFRQSTITDGQSSTFAVMTGTPTIPIPLHIGTQTCMPVRHISAQTNPRRGMKSVGCQTMPVIPLEPSSSNVILTKVQNVNNPFSPIVMFTPQIQGAPSLQKLHNIQGIQSQFPISPVMSLDTHLKESSIFEKTTHTKRNDIDEEYLPSVSEMHEEEETIEPTPVDHLKEKKYIVFDSCIDSLLYKVRCQAVPHCSSPIASIEKKSIGTFLTVTGHCINGHSFHLWDSQPRKNKVPMGNYLVASGILCSGSNFNKVYDLFKIIGLQQISKSNYYRYQQKFLFPSIDRHWHEEYNSLKDELKDRALCVSGDGQFDRPGHSAKFCTYSMMEMKTNKILDFKILQTEKSKSSVGLEKEAFQLCLERLLMNKFDVQIVATDRHASIKQLMSEKYSDISHQFDIWRFSKRLKKKLVAASKKKGCTDLTNWIQPVINHLWWCAKTCEGKVELLLEKWLSVLKHVCDEHFWEDGILYHGCSHDELQNEEQRLCNWLHRGQPPFESLESVVKDPQLLKDIVHLHNFCHTGTLEVFHSKLLRFCPKRNSFTMDAMEARIKLAVLSHNKNVNRKPAIIHYPRKSRLPLRYKRHNPAFSKAMKQWSVRKVYDPTVNDHLMDIVRDGWRICMKELSTSWSSKSETLPQNIATQEKIKLEAIEQHTSRFGTTL